MGVCACKYGASVSGGWGWGYLSMREFRYDSLHQAGLCVVMHCHTELHSLLPNELWNSIYHLDNHHITWLESPDQARRDMLLNGNRMEPFCVIMLSLYCDIRVVIFLAWHLLKILAFVWTWLQLAFHQKNVFFSSSQPKELKLSISHKQKAKSTSGHSLMYLFHNNYDSYTLNQPL